MPLKEKWLIKGWGREGPRFFKNHRKYDYV